MSSTIQICLLKGINELTRTAKEKKKKKDREMEEGDRGMGKMREGDREMREEEKRGRDREIRERIQQIDNGNEQERTERLRLFKELWETFEIVSICKKLKSEKVIERTEEKDDTENETEKGLFVWRTSMKPISSQFVYINGQSVINYTLLLN